jgi:hypothetical protein
MNNLSIRITAREGDQVRTIDIDTFPSAPPLIELVSGSTAEPSAPPRFTVTDGMVHDAHTGLTWSQDDLTSEGVPHKKAAEACKALRLGGYEDWRLPTRVELLTLVDDTRHDPAIDTEAFPSCKSSGYWTSTAWAASSSDCAWIVYFGYGYSGGDNRDSGYRVRAVRGPAGQ